MAFWTDKKGNKYTFKQFMAKWKEGITMITPLQQTKIQLRSSYLSTFGILCGFVITLLTIKKFWWLSIILLGALINSCIIIIGLIQKKNTLQNIENIINEKEVNLNDG